MVTYMANSSHFKDIFTSLVATFVFDLLKLDNWKCLRATAKWLCYILHPYMVKKYYPYCLLGDAYLEKYNCCRRVFGPHIAIRLCHVPSKDNLYRLAETKADIMLKTQTCSLNELEQFINALDRYIIELDFSNSLLLDQKMTTCLSGLNHLRILNISDCHVLNIANILSGNIPVLEKLYAAGNKIGVAHIACNLKELDLSRNEKRLILTGQLDTLTTLKIGCNINISGLAPLRPLLEALTSAKSLEDLKISSMIVETFEALKVFKCVRTLKKLAITDNFYESLCNITVMTGMLQSLTHITWLDFSHTSLGFKFIEALDAYRQPMVTLTTLNLSSQSRYIDHNICALARALKLLPALGVLYMQSALGNPDSVMVVLKSAPKTLRKLNLAYNRFYGSRDTAYSALGRCMRELLQFKKLTSVTISNPCYTKYSLIYDTNALPTIILSHELEYRYSGGQYISVW
jgi:hypothetical protein